MKQFFSKYGEELKTILFGIIWIMVAVAIWWNIVKNPIDELQLILKAKVTNGFIVDTWEDTQESDSEGIYWTHSYLYEYQIPDGRKYQGKEEGKGQITIDLERPYPIEVEYLPDNPKVSRIKGSGNADVVEWLWRKIGLGGLVLILVIAPGFIVIRNGIFEIQKIKKSNH